MVFNSFAYLIFLPFVAGVFFSFPKKHRWFVVLLASYYFYMSWKPVYGLLLLSTTLIDWSFALWMSRREDRRSRRSILAASIALNLGVLFFFKYFNFVSGSVWDLFRLSGQPLFLRIVLPIGISFYTFQSMAYMIDVYKGVLPAERHFGRYAAFVSFFPHLVSGPILRPSNIIPQLHEDKGWDPENLKVGLFWIATGLIKKVIIADRLSFFVDSIYGTPGSFSGSTLLVATYLFAFQIYCDFSGYTDIAIGSARILGYTIPENFRQPYFSRSITEFWQRWHISLSSWLRDYLYIPLGGNRRGKFRTYVNLMITMLLGGLWHGASWTFVFWGLLQGSLLTVSKLTWNARERLRTRLSVPSPLVSAVRIFVTFHLVCLSWVFFRAQSIQEALMIVKTVFFRFGSIESPIVPIAKIPGYFLLIAALVVFDALESKHRISGYVTGSSRYVRWGLAYAVIFALIFFGIQSGPKFIYFQF